MKLLKLFCKRFGHKWKNDLGDFVKNSISRKCKICGLKQKPLITENVLIDGLKWINADA